MIALALTNLLQKGAEFRLGEDKLLAFRTLKKKMMSAPIFRQPDFPKTFFFRTDASDYALGAIHL